MDNKKKSLDTAAHDIFSKKGYKNTNISEITQQAGMAVGSFYKYYQSKEDIFLAIYIQENESVRNQLIEAVDWQEEPVKVIDKIFDYSLEKVLNNRILAEWNKPEVSNLLHRYYASDKGKSDYTFHHFLIRTFQERLIQNDYDKDTIDKVIKVYDFIYYIDCHITSEDFEGYREALRTFVKYFLKGVFL